ncbi:mercuric resistance operon regulatory protein [bacterium BMS3Bbin08]|nr:mercuric resistance operon regulatory protein [bacterium BMS3Bbin08]
MTMTIGQLAKKAGVNIETIRYYERRELIPKPHRRKSGYREYSNEFVKRIQFIRHAKELGFSLKEVHELLSLRLDPETPCSEVRKRAEVKISDIDERIKNLQQIKKSLLKLSEACQRSCPISECPILEALEK